ncbi:putative anion transporter 6, chloroplastic isoform X1 [Senna tora]|uniref:Putative anion transporter 6, chloroplastic isoform X1 n=1 Tax=Senna tora TaxID=362788 RepID=A0A834X6Q1_9FABA|nr:putative anion transporter 6, chloroplastic isoform X1 [Senna tora]
MAKFTLRADHLCFPSHNTVCKISVKGFQLHRLPSKQHLRFRNLWSTQRNVKEREGIAKVLSGLRIDEVEQKGPVSDSERPSGAQSGSSMGSDGHWPPWKNLPQRYKLIGTTSLAFVICNMDKVNLSVAIIPMSHQFGWNSSVAGLVQSSFFWGYALSQLPGGWLAKIFGGRKVLKIGVLAWSVATALVPILAGYMPGLVCSRILVSRTIPLEERSRAVAFVFGGLSVGSVMGLLLAPPLIQNFGWESVFYIFGLFGIAWFLGFQVVEEAKAPSTGESNSCEHFNLFNLHLLYLC